jgi:hypothetical protein
VNPNQPQQVPNGAPPDWAMTNHLPQAEGAMEPAIALSGNVGLSDPDSAGHQWILLTLSDGTVSVTFRVPWHSVAAFTGQIAQISAGLSAQAQALAGPSLIVPPPGAGLPDLGIRRNGNGRAH